MKRSRLVSAVLAAASIAASCGGRAEAPLLPDLGSRPPVAGHVLPPPLPAEPAYIVRLGKSLDSTELEKVEKAPGVSVVAPVRTKVVSVSGPAGSRTLRVGAVEPLEYRSVAPPETRDAEFVWRSLLAGEAVLTFEGAGKLDLGDGDEIRIAGAETVEVGAFADNGHPNVADVLVPPHIGDAIDMSLPRTIVVGTDGSGAGDRLGRLLRELLPEAKVRRVQAPVSTEKISAPPMRGMAEQPGLLGPMSFEVLPNGFIRPDMGWVAANLARAEVPILGVVTCHRYVIPQLTAALSEIQQRGLAREIYQYGGCYVPRFINRDPSRSLSMHAFGLAFDINVPSNHMGTTGDMDRDIVAIFEKWGFEWGGRWSTPDPMHFELARLIST